MDAIYPYGGVPAEKSSFRSNFKFPFHLHQSRSNLGISGADPAACYFERGSLRSQHALIEGQDRDAGAGSDRD